MGWIVLLVLVGAVVGIIGMYNVLVSLRNRGQAAWSDVDVQLRRRYDLIPNLVETVKGYASHERNLFERVTEARSKAMAAQPPGEKAKAENFLTQALRQLFAVVENYPDLKASENFRQLQESLEDIERDIQMARRYYNAVARDYNIKTESFPSNIVAKMFNFRRMDFFELEEPEAREAPRVDFS